MTGIKKTIGLSNIAPPQAAVMDKIRRAEDAEKAGTIHELFEERPEKITRPSIRAVTSVEKQRAKTIGSVESLYREFIDGRWVIADSEPFIGGERLELVWDQLTESQKVAAGATERFRLEMDAHMERLALRNDLPHKVGGQLDNRSITRSKNNAYARMQAFEYILAPDVQELLRRFIDSTCQQISQCHALELIKGMNAGAIDQLLLDLVNKLIYQELNSRRRKMGDRGIRYIIASIDISEQILALLSSSTELTYRDTLLNRIISVHKDLGYTAYAARKSYRGSKLHRAYGVRIFTDEIERYRNIFDNEEIDLIRTAIASHSIPIFPIQHDPILASVRLADQLAPFYHTRVFTYFAEMEAIIPYLDDMLAAAQQENGGRWLRLRDALENKLYEQSIPTPLIEDLMASFRPLRFEINQDGDTQEQGVDIHPIDLKHCAGVVGGGIDCKIIPGETPYLHVVLLDDAFSEKYQMLFDTGQEQLLHAARKCNVSFAQLQAGGRLDLIDGEQSGRLVISQMQAG